MDEAQLREEFPVTKHWAYFDHAAVAPLPLRAQRAMQAWTEDLLLNGVAHSAEWFKRINEVRSLFAQFLNAETQELAFVKSTTEGIGLVAEGFPWQSGDNIITAAEEYPTNIYPWMNLNDRGVEVRLVPSREARISIDDLIERMDERTRLLSLSMVEYASGFRNDLDTIGAECRKRNILFLVDAIQGLGMLPLDVRKTPIDFLSADGHKWMLGPEGAGIFYIRRELLELLHPIGVGWNSMTNAMDFTNIDFRLKPNAGRWEGGTYNFVGIHGLGTSIELLLEVGIENVARRILAVTDYLCEQAVEHGLEVFSSRAENEKSGIVSLRMPDVDLREVVQRCRDAKIMVNHRAGRLRVSPHCYNTREEIDHLLTILGSGT